MFLRKLLKTVCSDCEVTLFWQNPLKAVCLAKSRNLYLGFHWYEYLFWFFKVTLKMVTEPL